MPAPTVTNLLLEVLGRPYYDDQPFTVPELQAIAQAEKLFDRPVSAASVRLRISSLVKAGKVIRVDSEHFVAKPVTCPPGGKA